MKYECDCGARYENLNGLEACQINNHGRGFAVSRAFLLFAGDDYYASGGWKDFVDRYDTLDEARNAGIRDGCDWWHVVNIESGQIVASKEHAWRGDGSREDIIKP